MAEGQILGLCDNNQAHVGLQNCPSFESQPKGLIITTKDFTIPQTPTDSTGATITQGEYLAQQAELISTSIKVYPLLDGLVNLEPNGGDTRIVQEGFGSSSINGHNEYQETYTYTKGGICLFKEVLKFHGQDMRVFWVDLDNRVYGVAQSDGTIRGFEITLGTQYRRNQGQTAAGYLVTIIYSNKYISDFKNMTSFLIREGIQPTRSLYPKVKSVTTDTTFTNLNIQLFMTCSGVLLKWDEGLVLPSLDAVEVYDNGGNAVTVSQISGGTIALNELVIRWNNTLNVNSGRFRLRRGDGETSAWIRNLESIHAVPVDEFVEFKLTT